LALWLARLVWLVVVIASLGLFALALPARYQELYDRYQPLLGLSLVTNRAGEPAVMVWPDSPGPAKRWRSCCPTATRALPFA
jgi:hypothetical protein